MGIQLHGRNAQIHISIEASTVLDLVVACYIPYSACMLLDAAACNVPQQHPIQLTSYMFDDGRAQFLLCTFGSFAQGNILVPGQFCHYCFLGDVK